MALPAAAQEPELQTIGTRGTGNGYVDNNSAAGVWIGGERTNGTAGNKVLNAGEDSTAAGYVDVDHVWAYDSKWPLCDA